MKKKIPKKGTLLLTVNKDVVKHLSLGLYRNFALSIKELVSNAYDAGATEVKIRLDLKRKKFIVRDNGKGMNLDEFKKEYLNIGYFKKSSNKPDELGRFRIGTFGIGFLAPLPYCRLMRVITKKKGGNSTIEATIKAENFFKEGTWEVSEERVDYEIYDSDLPKNEGETIISLEDIKTQISDELRRTESLGKSKIDQFGGFEKFRWTLAQYAPVQYNSKNKNLLSFFDDTNRTPMELWLDGEQIYRNIPSDVKILDKGETRFGNIHLKYAIMTPYKPIKPEEARGLQVRLKDVAIGLPRDFDVTKLGRVLGKLNMLCGEVQVISGLDNALMVNRDNFNYTKEVAEMFRFFQGKLRKWNDHLYNILDGDKKIYDALGSLKDDKNIVAELKNAELIHFAKERMRLPKAPITKTKTARVGTQYSKIVEALKEKEDLGYKIITQKGKVPPDKTPIKISPKRKALTIYEDHPSLKETVKYQQQQFEVEYDHWEPQKTPYSICRLHGDKRVVFNTSHPLFESKLSDDIIKKLALGIALIVKDRKDREEIIQKLNELLEYTFLG